MRVILVHGFNVTDGGKGSIGRLRSYFEAKGVEVVEFKYGWVGLLMVRFGMDKKARRLASMVRPGDCGVGHSNGCNLLDQAAWYGAKFNRLCYINPALDNDAPLHPSIERCHVWHSPHDAPTRFAKFLINHPWGDMGRRGYTNGDARYVNHNEEDVFPGQTIGHSDIFKPGRIEKFGPLIVFDLMSA